MNKSDLRSTNNEIIYSDKLSKYNTTVGIIIPTNSPDTMFNLFLSGLPNMIDIKDFVTILFNFQSPWSEIEIKRAVDICHSLGFKVRYTYNKYIFNKPYIPFNLMREDAAALLPEARIYLSADDDLKVLGLSPKINKSGGRQYLECIHYLLTHDKCGVVTTTGTIGKNPPRNYLGPNYKKGLNMYLMTGLGLFCKNIKCISSEEEGYWLPKDTHCLYGALEDLVAPAYRISRGYYAAKYNHVRVNHHISTKSMVSTSTSSSHPNGWELSNIIESNNVKYIKDNWNKDFDRTSIIQNSVSTELYLSNGGLKIWDKSICDELTSYYSPEDSVNIIKNAVFNLI